MVNSYLAHHGVKGMKWGVRRYQNPDGTLTPAGRKRYGINENGYMSKEGKKLFESDHAEGVKKASEANQLRDYMNTSKGEPFNIATKQDLLERRYKDTQDFIKMAKKEYNESYEMVVNKYGDVSLKSLDHEAAKGYEVVKNMEDIYKKVKLSDIK